MNRPNKSLKRPGVKLPKLSTSRNQSMSMLHFLRFVLIMENALFPADSDKPPLLVNTVVLANLAAFDDVHGLLMYPQPLVKQASSNMDTDYNPFDIVADFNSQYPFYFGTNGSIGKDHVDFECINI